MKIPEFTLRGFKRAREALTLELGELEREVMLLAWREGEVSVREFQQALGEDRAYTTVMTTLDRLFRKGLVTRRKSGRAFLYAPRDTREEFERGLAEDILDGLFSRTDREAEPLLACIVEAVGERSHRRPSSCSQSCPWHPSTNKPWRRFTPSPSASSNFSPEKTWSARRTGNGPAPANYEAW